MRTPRPIYNARHDAARHARFTTSTRPVRPSARTRCRDRGPPRRGAAESPPVIAAAAMVFIGCTHMCTSHSYAVATLNAPNQKCAPQFDADAFYIHGEQQGQQRPKSPNMPEASMRHHSSRKRYAGAARSPAAASSSALELGSCVKASWLVDIDDAARAPAPSRSGLFLPMNHYRTTILPTAAKLQLHYSRAGPSYDINSARGARAMGDARAPRSSVYAPPAGRAASSSPCPVLCSKSGWRRPAAS